MSMIAIASPTQKLNSAPSITPLTYPYIETYQSPVAGTLARVAGRNITVANIAIWYYQDGEQVENIANDYDLSVAQVFSALAYYHDHRNLVDAQILDEAKRYNEAIANHHSITIDNITRYRASQTNR